MTTNNVYEHLADALDRLPNGFPRTPSNVEIPLLKRIFSPEDASLASQHRERCIGCGLCVTGCPSDIAKLQRKPDDQVVHPPVDYPTWERERLLNRELMD